MVLRGIRQIAIKPALGQPLTNRRQQQRSIAAWINAGIRHPQQSRGVKTQTTVKIKSLPQGELPPLQPADHGIESPLKPFPPVIQQHLNHVDRFSDCVVLTRVGDFYEMYGRQADEYAPLVNLKVARRVTAIGDIAMAGFLHTQLDRFLKMFVQDLGKKVAISEQIRVLSKDNPTKGGTLMYDRKVTRVVTAGTLVDETFVDPYDNNYLLAITFDSPARGPPTTQTGVSWLDLSSGDFFTQACDVTLVSSLVARVRPCEIILRSNQESAFTDLKKVIGEGSFSLHYHSLTQDNMTVQDWSSMLERPMEEDDVADFSPPEIAAGSLILDYVRDKLMDNKILLQPPVRRAEQDFMTIDKQSLRGLEIRSTIRDGGLQGSLLHTVRRTVTRSGARLLARRLVSPSMSLSEINQRLDLVQELVKHRILHEDIVELLRRTSDSLRLLQRLSIAKGDADDLLGLAQTVDVTVDVVNVLHNHIVANQDRSLEPDDEPNLDCLWNLLKRFDLEGPQTVTKAIRAAIDEEALGRKHAIEDDKRAEALAMSEQVATADANGDKIPKFSRRSSKSNSSPFDGTEEVWSMRRDSSPTLAKAHRDLANLMEARRALELDLRQKLKSENLTLKWSAQLSHFIHVKNRDAANIISAFPGARAVISKKTTCSFYLADWSHLGVRIDDAKLRIRAEEEAVFTKLRNQVIENIMRLRRNAMILDELDVACSSATLAQEQDLTRPVVDASTSHVIINGRHPTVDAGLRRRGRSFTPNHCSVGDSKRIYYITGPNMAGKSTYLRQNALITILAQTGAFVPAQYARIGLVDKIFSRVGSADNLYDDQSTFMVEMMETAEILRHATSRSFVIMDEVGRGTTPEDGVAVGFACLHHLHHVNRCRTLFATHFHALADMTSEFDSVARFCTDVVEMDDGSWAYLHEIRDGVNRASHALKVARIAGLPEEAIAVAQKVLSGNHHQVEKGTGQVTSVSEQRSKLHAAG